jgi:hypothetical protein
MTTWILTGSPNNYQQCAARDFNIIGLKERRFKQGKEVEMGDRFVFYLTGKMQFAGSIIIESDMFEDRETIWCAKQGKSDDYPWRFHTCPEIVLGADQFLPAEALKDQLEHIKKWPAEHWKLAFQGQLRTISGRDTKVLTDALHARNK